MTIRRRLAPAATAFFLVGVAASAAEPPALGRDLEGVWTLGTYTPLQRPKDLKSLALTPAEAEAFEAPRRALHGMLPSKTGEVGQEESEFNERGEGLARVKGEIRSSWIIDPADGQIPFTKAARLRFELDSPRDTERLDNPEDADASSRCIGNAASGAPMIGGPDANLIQVVQTQGSIAILSEKYHDVRVVLMEGAPPSTSPPPSRLGHASGRWDGDTLVVETTGFLKGAFVRSGRLIVTETTQVTERFTRTGRDEILYEFRVEDPSLYTAPWRGEMTLRPAKGAIYEFACHEGNYSLPSMLRAARRLDGKAAKPSPAR